MSKIVTITINIWKIKPLSFMVKALQEAGWTLPDGLVLFQYYRASEDAGGSRHIVAAEKLSEVLILLEEKLSEGHIIILTLQWEGTEIDADFRWESNDFSVTFNGTHPQLEACNSVADFNWLLFHVLCPLINVDVGILEVECSEDRR